MAYKINLQLIKQKRLEKKLTLQEMAEALGLGSKSDYYKRESGDTRFKSTELPLLATKLGVPINSFFTPNVEKIETK